MARPRELTAEESREMARRTNLHYALGKAVECIIEAKHAAKVLGTKAYDAQLQEMIRELTNMQNLV